MTARQPAISISIVCTPEQFAEVLARVRVLQADLLRLGATCWVSTHHAPPATVAEPSTPPIAPPAPVRWEDLADRADRCPGCLHWWVSHGVPGEDSYSCTTRADSVAEQPIVVCGCTFAEGNRVTPRQVRIWHDGTSWPLAPWQRADCGHRRCGPIRPDTSQECLDCGAAVVADG